MKKLKKELIVQELFGLVAQECLKNNKADLSHVKIPLIQLSDSLFSKYNIRYSSEQHLYHQLKSYEKDVAMSLFSKTTKKDGISITILNLHQFKQLVILNKSLKIMLANGAWHLLQEFGDNSTVQNLYLGTGSECYYLAKLILDEVTYPINIFTSNIGIIRLYCDHAKPLKHIKVYSRFGQVNKDIYSIIHPNNTKNDFFLTTNFDAIIQSPRYIKDNTTYVIFSEETHLKEVMLHNTKGIKILLLTLFEFLVPKDVIYPYGNILEYDYIITPTEKNNEFVYEHYLNKLAIKPYIQYFSYNIFTT